MPRPFRGRQPLGKTLREIDKQNQANRLVSGPGVLVSTGLAGQSISLDAGDESDGLWIELTSVGTAGQAGQYGWREKIPTGATGWTVGTLSGTLSSNPAVNVFVSEGFAIGTHVRAWFDPDTTHPRFMGEPCTPCSGGPPGPAGGNPPNPPQPPQPPPPVPPPTPPPQPPPTPPPNPPQPPDPGPGGGYFQIHYPPMPLPAVSGPSSPPAPPTPPAIAPPAGPAGLMLTPPHGLLFPTVGGMTPDKTDASGRDGIAQESGNPSPQPLGGSYHPTDPTPP